MDAFAVSVTNGLCLKNISLKHTLSIGICFGLFQGAMPTIGYALGNAFADYITQVDHYIAFVLLGFIGIRMVAEGIKDNGEEGLSGSALTFSGLIIQGIATSIDALAVGVSFAAMRVNIAGAAAFICAVTFLLCLTGVRLGRKFGNRLGNRAEIAGGVILAALGIKIFIEHMFL